MTTRRPLSRVSWTATAGLAAALPLSAYFALPFLGGFDMRSMLMTALILACLADFSPLRIPFELVWPACGAALLGALGPGRYECMGMLAAYLTAAHLASRGPRWRPTGCAAPGAFTPAGVCVAAMTATAAFSGCLRWVHSARMMPTAYSLPTGAVLYGPYALPDGALLLAFCLLAALWPCWRSWKGFPVHPVGVLLAVPILAALIPVLCASLAHLDAWRPRAWRDLSATEALALVLLAWLLCRLAAKLLVRGVERREPELGLYAAGVGLAVLVALAVPLQSKLELAFLAGLMAGAACPQRGGAPKPSFTARQAAVSGVALFLIGAPMVAFNAVHVFPRNYLDPRNYPAAAARDIRGKHFDRLDARLAFFEKRLPHERGIHFWRARAALAQNQVDTAIREANAASYPAAVPPVMDVQQSQWASFMQELRDRVSRAPGQVALLDYTRLLAARNGLDAAVGFLQLRREPEATADAALSPSPLAATLAFLLDDPHLESRLASWPPGELLSLLRQCGATIEEAPASFPKESLPLALAAGYLRGRSLQIGAAAPQQSARESLPIAPTPCPPEFTLGWRWKNEGDVWTFHLIDVATGNPLAPVLWTEGRWRLPQASTGPSAPPMCPPAILVLLPRRDANQP